MDQASVTIGPAGGPHVLIDVKAIESDRYWIPREAGSRRRPNGSNSVMLVDRGDEGTTSRAANGLVASFPNR